MRFVEQIMGMPITIDIPNCQDESVFQKAFTRLRAIDEQFSTYKLDSEVSSYRRGELDEQQLSAELTEVIKACRQAEEWTDGYFSAWASDLFDPSGYVKGWAIAEAGKIIDKQGFRSYCIGAAGDILARSNNQNIWQIGIQDPKDKLKIRDRLSITNGAVATSGNYERGRHIINPKTGQLAEQLLSISILGPDIIQADILATAVFAKGPTGLELISRQPGYAGLAIMPSGRLVKTKNFETVALALSQP